MSEIQRYEVYGSYASDDGPFVLYTDNAAALAAKDAEIAQCVSLIATMAHALGHWAGTARTAIDGWSEDWHGCVYVDLPAGQVSWHYHDSQAHLFAHLPPYCGEWDGHDTPEKYRRVLQRPLSNARAERAEAALRELGKHPEECDDESGACVSHLAYEDCKAERDALRAAIEKAPHASHCLGGVALGRPSAYPCDCWKRDALSGRK